MFVNVSYGREWLNTDRTEKKILKDMRIISDSDNKSIKIFSIITFGIMLAAAFVFLFVKNVPTAVIVVLAGIYMLFVPVINRKKALARIQNDVYISFSEYGFTDDGVSSSSYINLPRDSFITTGQSLYVSLTAA